MINPSKEQEEEWSTQRKLWFARFCWVNRYRKAPSGITWAERFEKNEGVNLYEYARERMKAKESQQSS